MKHEDKLREMESYIDGERKIVEHKEKNRATQEAINLRDKEWVEEIGKQFKNAQYPKYSEYIPLAGDNKNTHSLVIMAFNMGIDACMVFIKKEIKSLKSKMGIEYET